MSLLRYAGYILQEKDIQQFLSEFAGVKNFGSLVYPGGLLKTVNEVFTDRQKREIMIGTSRDRLPYRIETLYTVQPVGYTVEWFLITHTPRDCMSFKNEDGSPAPPVEDDKIKEFKALWIEKGWFTFEGASFEYRDRTCPLNLTGKQNDVVF